MSVVSTIESSQNILELKLFELQNENEKLRNIIRELKRLHFGKKSEVVVSQQLGLFNEAEVSVADKSNEETEEEIEVGTHIRKKGGRKKLSENIPREEKTIELLESERVCECCNETMKEIGEERSEKIEIIPASAKVICTIRKKYACSVCAEGVKQAPVPVQLIPKSIATESTLAWIVTGKFVDHLPLYRTENILNRYGVELSRGTLARWVIKCAEAVEPLINLLNSELLESEYLQMDETRIQVLKEPGKRAESLSYMWVRARPGPKPIILYEYDPTRSGSVPVRLLDEFSGVLQVDGYEGYGQICESGKITRAGCMAHSRRKFFEAFSHNKKSAQAAYALKLIKKLYKIEEAVRGKSAQLRYEKRQTESVSILADMKAWMDEMVSKIPPKSPLGVAIHYTLNQWPYLTYYAQNGLVEIDNNFIENKIRPFALGRKNWLFSDSVEGAKASANLYGLINTALANNQEPFNYLKRVFESLPAVKTIEDLEKLLPF